jgi:hypothetical protein
MLPGRIHPLLLFSSLIFPPHNIKILLLYFTEFPSFQKASNVIYYMVNVNMQEELLMNLSNSIRYDHFGQYECLEDIKNDSVDLCLITCGMEGWKRMHLPVS